MHDKAVIHVSARSWMLRSWSPDRVCILGVRRNGHVHSGCTQCATLAHRKIEANRDKTM